MRNTFSNFDFELEHLISSACTTQLLRGIHMKLFVSVKWSMYRCKEFLETKLTSQVTSQKEEIDC